MIKILSSYSSKLLILTLLVSIIPIIFFGSFFYVDEINNKIKIIKNELIFSSENNARYMSDWINERKSNVKDISENSLVISATKKLIEENPGNNLFNARFTLEKQLNVAHQNHYSWLQNLRISDPITGKVIFYTGNYNPSFGIQFQDHFRDAVNGKITTSEIYPSYEIIKNEFGSYERGVPTFLISSPIKGETGIIAILTARVNVFEMTSHTQEYSLGNFLTRDSYLLNSNGVLISKPNSWTKLWNMELIEQRPEFELSIIDKLSKDHLTDISNLEYIEIGWDGRYNNLIGEKSVAIGVPVENTKWYYLTEINYSEAYYDMAHFQMIFLAIIGITILTVTGISLHYSSKLTRPISNLIKATQQIKQGNMRVNVESCGSDEIHDLAVSLNSMASSLYKAKQSEQAILNKFKDLYERSPSLNRTIDMDGRITDCNSSYAKAFGYNKHEIIGKSIFDFIPKEDLADLQDSFDTWKKTGKALSREIIFKKKNGSVFPGLLSASNLYDNQGKIIGSNTIIQDLSIIRDVQLELNELRTKRLSVIGELTARIAHDMRNPLSVIKNSAALIKMTQKNTSKKSQEHWEQLERGIYRIAHQVDDVLDYVRKPVIKKQNVKFSLILHEAIDRSNIPNNIKVNLPKNDGKILCDPERFEVVFVNLIMNASQAIGMDKGEITIEFTENYKNRYSKITISDNGPGVPQELMSKIFDPLFTTRQIGTGLGLPSCKNIVEYHRGTIKVESTKGEGTTFIIKIPTQTEWEEIIKIGEKEKLTDFITSLNANL